MAFFKTSATKNDEELVAAVAAAVAFSENNDEEIVSVIAAALSAFYESGGSKPGSSSPGLVVRPLWRTTDAWILFGKTENIH